MHSLIEKLKSRLLPEFNRIAAQIHETTPLVSAKVYDSQFGYEQFLGHGFFIDLMLGNCLTEVDNVALEVSIYNLTSVPEINADVAWGHPSGYLEAEFSRANLEISDAVLEELDKDLPRLYEALFEAVKRRKPANE